VPDHSSLSRIRDRYGEKIFESVFREIVALCGKKGLVHGECCVMSHTWLQLNGLQDGSREQRLGRLPRNQATGFQPGTRPPSGRLRD